MLLRAVCVISALPLALTAGQSHVSHVVPDFGPDFVPSQEENMNGEYVMSSTPGGTPGLFPAKYKNYPGGAESFDLYSPPMTTYYSQVWWSPLEPTKLPEDLVKKYEGKGMAIIGWEIDQVRKTPEGDVSLPITASYNHHYGSKMIGGSARFKRVMLDGPDDPRAASLMETAHGNLAWDQPQYVVELGDQLKGGSTQSFQKFANANGGEYRKSYHGFPPGYALVVDSPTEFQVTPMQIDTWNRDAMNISGPLPAAFVPGPLPRNSLAPKNALYSGLLECPLSTRLTKRVDGTYVVHATDDACAEPIATLQECFQAAAVTLHTGGQSFVNSTGSDLSRPAGCSASVSAESTLSIDVFFNKLVTSKTACSAGVQTVAGATSSLVHVSVSLEAVATITLQGPAAVWFGVGFGAHAMLDAPWTIVVDGNGTVSEYKLGNHMKGTQLKPSVKIISSDVTSGVRTVVLSRSLEGASQDYYAFNFTSTTIPFINAVGRGPDLGYHKNKTPNSLTLLPISTAGACVCPQEPKPFGQASGELVYHRNTSQAVDTGTGAVGIGANKCPSWPASEVLRMKNPTCDIRTFTGGQSACHHMWSLLDADQEIPWPDQPLVFYHKYRFWVQPYNKSYHTALTAANYDTSWLIGGAWEYDVPKCADGVLGCSMGVPGMPEFDGTWIHTITGNHLGTGSVVALNFHCHAPTCLSMSVYACEKDTALEDCNATMGKLLCHQEPIYGGAGNSAIDGTRFGEVGYIAIPDCFWGAAEFGLEQPYDLTDVPLHVVKHANATFAHHGEMAGGQPWRF